MCRDGINGSGRRCPIQNEPGYRAEMNARRRARYAAKKKVALSSVTSTMNTSAFPDVHGERPVFEVGSAGFVEYETASHEFLKSVTDEDFDLAAWKEFRDSDDYTYDQNDPFEDLSVLDERDCVEFYTEHGYREIKSFLSPTILYGPHAGEPKPPTSGKHQETLQSVVNKIDSALGRVKEQDSPRMVYRGISLPKELGDENVDSWLAEHYPVGGMVQDDTYLSTTLDPQVAAKDFTFVAKESKRAVVFEILSRKGVAVGEGVSSVAMGEAEVLMPRNTGFRVVSVDTDVDFKVGSFSKKVAVVRLMDAS